MTKTFSGQMCGLMCFLFFCFFPRTQALEKYSLHSQENPSCFTFPMQGLLEASMSPATKPWLFLVLQKEFFSVTIFRGS